jgi:uncharacterized Tic20 family protein
MTEPTTPQPGFPRREAIDVEAEVRVVGSEPGPPPPPIPPPSPPPPPPPGAPPVSPPRGPGGASQAWAMAAHLSALIDLALSFFIPIGWLPPLVIWLAFKDSDAYVEHHSRESLQFQISLLLWGLLAWVLVCCLIGIPMLLALWLFKLVAVIIAAVQAAQGVRFRYPLTWRFLGDSR